MSKWIGNHALVSILSLLLISACATSNSSQKPITSSLSQIQLSNSEQVDLVSIGPKIPFDNQNAFFPIHPSGKGVYYSWDECTRRILVCVKWEYKEVLFRFDDENMMNWFINNNFGFKRLERP